MTVSAFVEALPAASRAVIVITFEPVCRGTLLTVQFAVPMAFPLPPRLLAHMTCVTPTASLDVPLTFTVPVVEEKVDDEVGWAIVTTGAVVSGAL